MAHLDLWYDDLSWFLSPFALVRATIPPERDGDLGPGDQERGAGMQDLKMKIPEKKAPPLRKLCILYHSLALTFTSGLLFGLLEYCLALWEL